ncbi:MAG: hypothetical protein V1493_05770 [Candidatus Diapherotrites archaeon]
MTRVSGTQKKNSRQGNPNIARAARKARLSLGQKERAQKRTDYAKVILRCWEATRKGNGRVQFASLFNKIRTSDGYGKGSLTGIRGYASMKEMLSVLERSGWLVLETEGQKKFYRLSFRAQRELERRSKGTEISRPEQVGQITSLKPDKESMSTVFIGARKS